MFDNEKERKRNIAISRKHYEEWKDSGFDPHQVMFGVMSTLRLLINATTSCCPDCLVKLVTEDLQRFKDETLPKLKAKRLEEAKRNAPN